MNRLRSWFAQGWSIALVATLLAATGCGNQTSTTSSGTTTTLGVATLVMTANPASIQGDGVTTSTITVLAQDSTGAAVSGAAIALTTNSATATLSATTGTTSTTGVFSATVTDSVAETVTITATSGSISNTTSIVVTAVGTTITSIPATLSLGASTYSVKSDNSNTATISATVLDTSNAVIAGIPVSFSTDAGQLSAASVTTDVSGVASVTFSSGTGNRSNQTATITANVGTLPAQTLLITIKGSTLTLTPTTTALTTGTTPITDTLTATALDAGGNPIANTAVVFSIGTASSATGTVDGAATVTKTTDGSGIATVTVVGTSTGSTGALVVQASGLGDQNPSQNYTVSAAATAFQITSPAVSATLPALVTNSTPTVPASNILWTAPPTTTAGANAIKITANIASAGVPTQTRIAFATTLGGWNAASAGATAVAGVPSAPVSPVVVFNLGGATSASATLVSDRAGIANIRVYDPDHPDVYSDVRTVVIAAPFASNPDMTFQADLTQLPVSVGGATNSTILRATVRTPTTAQPIANVPVLFSITNPTGGGETITPAVGFTDSSGVVQATFKAGSLASGAKGVIVQAQVIDPTTNTLGAAKTVNIVIGGVPASIVLGRSTVGTASTDNTYYTMPMTVLVVDGNGSPMANTTVSLKVWPSFYHTGYWTQVPDTTTTTTSGTATTSVTTLKWQPLRSIAIQNEDVNKNLIHDLSPSDEDINGDGVLTPPNAAGGTIPSTVTTDQNGLAAFDLIYPKAMAVWIDDDITASVRVSGTESSYTYPFTLPVLKADVDAGLVLDSPFTSGGSRVMTISGNSGTTDSPLSFTINMTDANSNPAPGVSVNVSSNLGIITTNPIPVSDANGNVTFSLQSYLPGTGIITATATGYQTAYKSFTVKAGIPAKTTVSLTSTNVTKGNSVGVSAQVVDQFGNPVEDNTLVQFTSSSIAGIWSSQYGLTTGGVAAAIYTPTVAGNETLTVDVVPYPLLNIVSVPGTAQLKVDSPVVSAITLQKSSNAGLVADGVSSVNITITMTDAAGAPVVGIVPVVSTTLGLLSAPLATDGFGQTTVTLTTQNTVGIATVTASYGAIASGTASVQFVGGAAASGTVSFSPNNIAYGDPTVPTVSAKFVDSYGNPVPDGTQVQLAVTTANATLGVQFTTTTGGIASTTVTPSAAGTVTVTATDTATLVSASGNLTVTSPQVTSMTLAASQLTQNADGTPVTLTATLKDSLGNSASGVTVSFASTFGALSALTAVTDAAGQASATLSSTVVGTSSVTASVAGTTPQTVTIQFVAVTTPVVPTSLGLGTSQVSVKSDGSDIATITATVLDANNVVIPNATVNFSAPAGQLSAGSAVTDATGKATVGFSAGTVDPQNQVVLITATIGALSRQIPVQITGSTVSATLSAPAVTDNGLDSSALTIMVLDAGGKPVYNTAVSLKASINNVVAAGGVALTTTAVALGTTDINGQIQATMTGIAAGTVTLTASALNATWNIDLAVNAAANVLSVTAPATSPFQQTIGLPVTVTVTVPNPGLGVGQTHFVTFATTLGELDGVAGQRVVTKDVSALAAPASISAVLTSSGAGLADVLIYDNGNTTNRASTRIAYSADISSAATVRLQATASTLPISTATNTYTTTLRAQVQTSGGQPVGNVPVAFSLPTPIGGGEAISPSIAYTDSSGIATATFSAGTLSSGANGVTVQADVFRTAPLTTLTGSTNIIVGGVAGSVIVGEAALNQVVDAGTGGNSALYKVPMAVMVADAGGNPVANSTVTLSLWPVQYSTGSYTITGRLTDGTPLTSANITGSYPNEDINENLVLDATEDLNGDGLITPPNTAAGSVPRTVTTDANGVANFEMIYPKANANWITARLRASVLVAGTETSSEHVFRLPANPVDALYAKLSDSPFTAPGAAFLTVTPTSLQAVANGTAQTITANVVQISGGPVADGTAVNFGTTFGTLSAASATTVGGQASVTLSSTVVGQGTVTVTTGSATPATTAVSFVPGPANTAQVDVAPNATALGTPVTLTARVFDAQGNPVADSTGVDFSSSASGTFSAIHVGTVGGIASTTFTPTIAGNHTITVTVTGTAVTNTGALYVSALPVGSITLTPSQNVQIANGTAVTLTALVTDTSGNLMTGQPVSFVGNFGVLSAVSATTGVAGTATVTLSSTAAGSSTITASSSTVTGSAAVTFVPGPAASASVVLAASTVSLGASTSVTVSVVDATGNAVADGTAIDLTSSLGGAFSQSHIAVVGGVASATFTPSVAGTHTITATVTGSAPVVSGTATLQVGSLPVGSVTVTPAATQLIADGVSTTTVGIKVLDTVGAPVVGVTPTVTASNAVTVGVIPVTDANGVSSVTLTAGSTVGVSTIAASNGGISGTTTITLIGGAAASVSVSSTPNNVALGQTTTVTARVLDAQGNPVPDGTQVSFAETTATGATLSALNVVTTLGNASIMVTPAAAGTVTIGATVGALAQVTTNITVNTLSASALILAPSQTAQTANGVATVTLTATVQDTVGNGVNGVTVTFTSDLGTLSAVTATTAGGGLATVTLASNTVGTASVTATASGLTQATSVSFVPGSASAATASLSASNVALGGTTTVSIRVTDATGNAVVDGTGVDLVSNLGGTFTIAHVATLNGVASTSFVPSANGTHTITATVTGTVITATATLQVASLAVTSVTVTPSVSQLVANGASTMTVDVTVFDSSGAPVAGVTPAVTANNAMSVGAVAATGANGITTVTLTAGSTVGTATVLASVSGVSGSTTVALVGGTAVSVAASATPNNVSLGQTSTVQALVRDAQGNPVPDGTQVTFAETTATGATLSATYAITVGGIAQIAVTPAAAGTLTIGATVGALPQVTTNITVNTLSAAALTFAASQAAQTADGASLITLTATVTDSVGNGVNGITVTFTTTLGTLSAITATTAGGGVASVTLKSSTVGSSNVTATASGLTQTQTVNFVPGAASAVAVSLSPNNVQSGNSTTVTVRVTDATGNAVINGTGVDLASTAAGTFAVTHLSTSNGSASTTFTPSAVATHTVSATVTGTVITGSNTLTVNAASSSTLTLTTTSSASQLTANNLDTATVTATVKDGSGNAVVDGTVVTFVTDRGTLTSGVTTANVVTATTVGGSASVTVDAGKVAETRTVTITVSGLTDAQQITFNPGVMNIGTATSRILSSPASVAAGATATFTIVAVDANNNPVADGTVFNVAATSGTLASVTATTASGVASFSWTAPASGVTSATFTATASGGSLTQTVAVTGTATGSFNPVSMSVAVSSSSITVLGEGSDTTTLTVTVVDEAGNAIIDPAAGGNVQVSILSGPNGGEVLSDGVTTTGNGGAALALTTVNGQTSVNLKAGTTPGTIRVQFQAVKDQTGAVLATPVTAISAPIAVNSGAPNSLVVLLNNGASAITNNTNGSYSRDVSALVLDQYGNPVPDGTAVYFGLIDYWTMGVQTDVTRTYPAAITLGTTTAAAATFTDGSGALNYTTGNNGQGGVAVGDKIYVSTSPAGTDTGIHYISVVNSATQLTAFNNFAETSAADQYVIGRAKYGKVGGSATTVSGIAKVVLTYPVSYLYYPITLHAETAANGVWGVYDNVSSYEAIAPLTLTPAPATIKSAAGTAISAVVTVKDSGSNIVPRVQTNVFQAPSLARATLTGLALSAAGITDVNGQVTVTATIPGTAVTGDTIAITVDCGGYTATINVTVN